MPEILTKLIENNAQAFLFVAMALQVIFGVLLCFAGFKTFRMVATIIAMITVGSIAFWGGSTVFDRLYVLILLTLLGFFLGAIFRTPFEHVTTVLYGLMVGQIAAVIALVVLTFMGIVQNPLDLEELKKLPIYYAGGAAGLGAVGIALMYIKFRKPVSIFVTGFNGALLLTSGVMMVLAYLDIVKLTLDGGIHILMNASPYILPGIVGGLCLMGILFQTANAKSKEIDSDQVDASERGVGERII